VDGPGGQPVEQVTGTTATYLVADQQGSTRLLTSAAGKVTATYSYSPYGTVTSHAGAASTALQFDGQYTDAESGYQYLQARYYDPATGQFLSVDPDVSLTAQAYDFAGGNPLNATDPTGLSWYNPFSWHRLWHWVAAAAHVVAEVAEDVHDIAVVVGVVATGVALCAATACLGDLAFLGIDAAAFYATADSWATTVSLAAESAAGLSEQAENAAERTEDLADSLSGEPADDACAQDVDGRACLEQTARQQTVAAAGDFLDNFDEAEDTEA
jgi:RHS repeat-associated protein